MTLDLRPPFPPMEALSVAEVPSGDCWQYEPKWDGFRCLAFRDRRRVELQSKSCRMLTRYFPDLVDALLALDAPSFVLDGEIVVPLDGAFSFDALLQRIHPAPSRIRRLASETPALLIVFDLLAGSSGKSLIKRPLFERRKELEEFVGHYVHAGMPIRLSLATAKPAEARKWLDHLGGALDGIIAKRQDFAYRSGDRSGMQKIKNYRSADCVVGGFRYNEGKDVVGSLLLGLYDDAGALNHVGFTSTIPAAEKETLTAQLEKLIAPPGFTGRKPGGLSRWSTRRSAEFRPLRPKLVVEVCYDHFSGDRFRHGTSLRRWRPDKSPKQCTIDQVRQKKADLTKLLG